MLKERFAEHVSLIKFFMQIVGSVKLVILVIIVHPGNPLMVIYHNT